MLHKDTQRKANMNVETRQLSVELLNALNGHGAQKLLSVKIIQRFTDVRMVHGHFLLVPTSTLVYLFLIMYLIVIIAIHCLLTYAYHFVLLWTVRVARLDAK